MSKTLRTVGMVVAAVALVATGVGALAGAGVLGAAAAGTAGTIAGISVGTISAIGTYAGIAASVIGAIAAATAPGFSAQGSSTSFQTNPQSGLPYAMGRTRMSGLRTYARTYDGFKQQSKDDILAFMALLTIAGPIHGIEQFKADNEVVTFAAGGNANGRFIEYMGQQVSMGAKSGPALGMTFGGKPFPDWTPAHKLSGMAHAQWALRYDTKAELYGAGAPEPAWIGKWVLVYDPRLDSTFPGGSGSCRPLQEETYVWSDNPGLHALTWSLGRWLNGKRVCGIGAPVENIRVGEFVECANVCEANAWRVGGVEWTTDSKWDTLKRILQAGGAVPTKTGAMIGCMVSAPRTAIATIESRHLHDGGNFPMTKPRRDRFNTVIPRYVDEDSDWAVVSGKAISEPVFVGDDGGARTKEIDFALVQVFSGQEAKQPGQLAAYAIVDSREAGPWTFTTGPEWLGLKTGDVVYLNVPEEGIANQPVLITRRSLDPATTKVSFTVQTETYSKHAYALGETTTPPAPFSLTAPSLRPAAPLALNWNVGGTTSGEGFPALIVTGESQHPSADAVFIDYRRTGTDAWSSSAILSAIEPVSHVIAPLESQARYDVRIGYRIGTIDGDVTIFTNVETGLGKVTIIEGQLGQVRDNLALVEAALAAEEARARADVEAARAEVAEVRGEVTEARADVSEVRGELSEARDELAASDDAIRATIVEVEQSSASAHARIDSEVAVRATEDSAIVARNDAMVAEYNGLHNTVSARIEQEEIARSNADGAIIARNDLMVAEYNGINARLEQEVIARANADGAIIARNDLMVAEYNGISARLESEEIARANADSAIVSRNDLMVAEYNGIGARLESEVIARADAISAIVTRNDTMVAEYNGIGARVMTTETVAATAFDRTSGARWSKEATAGNGRAQLTVYAFDDNGNIMSGVDIIGDLTLSGDLILSGSIRTSTLELYAAQAIQFVETDLIVPLGKQVWTRVTQLTLQKRELVSTLDMVANIRMKSTDDIQGSFNLVNLNDGSVIDTWPVWMVGSGGNFQVPIVMNEIQSGWAPGTYTIAVDFFRTEMDGTMWAEAGSNLKVSEVKR